MTGLGLVGLEDAVHVLPRIAGDPADRGLGQPVIRLGERRPDHLEQLLTTLDHPLLSVAESLRGFDKLLGTHNPSMHEGRAAYWVGIDRVTQHRDIVSQYEVATSCDNQIGGSMAKREPMKQVCFRIEKRLWDDLGDAVGKKNRSLVIRQFIAWYTREPGAKLPKRPGDEGFEEQFSKPKPRKTAQHLLDPHPHTLYRFFDKYGELLYVGITMDLPSRMGNHRREKPWWADAAWIDIQHCDSRGEALDAERMAIKAEKPLYNVVHNDAAGEASR